MITRTVKTVHVKNISHPRVVGRTLVTSGDDSSTTVKVPLIGVCSRDRSIGHPMVADSRRNISIKLKVINLVHNSSPIIINTPIKMTFGSNRVKSFLGRNFFEKNPLPIMQLGSQTPLRSYGISRSAGARADHHRLMHGGGGGPDFQVAVRPSRIQHYNQY